MAGVILADLINNGDLNGATQGEAKASATPVADLQVRLFELYANLFTSLTGTGVASIADVDELQGRMIARVRDNRFGFQEHVNSATAELQKFYQTNAQLLFQTAKSFGGVKLVSGGQRAFGSSALTALARGLGLTIPVVGLGAAAAGGAVGFGKEKAGEVWEKQRASKTMLGMFASAKPK